MIFSKSSPPDKLEYMRDIRLSPETLKKKEGKERSLKVGFDCVMEARDCGNQRRKERERIERQKARNLKFPRDAFHHAGIGSELHRDWGLVLLLDGRENRERERERKIGKDRD